MRSVSTLPSLSLVLEEAEEEEEKCVSDVVSVYA